MIKANSSWFEEINKIKICIDMYRSLKYSTINIKNLIVIKEYFESILLLRALRAIYKQMDFFCSYVQLMKYFALSVTISH